MRAIAARHLVFLDEAGVNRAMTRRYARAPRGQRAVGHTPIRHGANVTIIGAVRLDGVVDACVFEGSTNGERFAQYIEEGLARRLRLDDVVVMDNLAAHRSERVYTAIKAAGARLLFLPPYSPDYSPIEPCWGKVKQLMRGDNPRTFQQLVCAARDALRRVSGADAAAWFEHCGYRVGPD